MIAIRQRLRPFSHTPGASCVVPGTHSILTAYPTLIQIDDLSIPLPVSGPVRDFTLQQDLERSCVWVFGHARKARLHIRIEADSGGFWFESGRERTFYRALIAYEPSTSCERLSLGSHRAQDWDLISRRFALPDILPSLFSLGQKTPPAFPRPTSGTARLLDFHDVNSLEMFCRAAFRSLLVPRLVDDQRQGLCPFEEITQGNPFFLLTEGSRRLRSLFLAQEETTIALLPTCLFAAGRMTDVRLPGIGTLHFEWLKRHPSRAFLVASEDAEIAFRLPSGIQTFRVQMAKKQTSVSQKFAIEKGRSYAFDRFYLGRD